MKYKYKKTLGFLLLILMLIILKFFLGSNHLSTILEELPELIILLTIISFIMMIVPLIFKLKNKQLLDNSQGKKICFFNSIILFVLFSIPNISTITKGPIDNGMVNSLDPISFAKDLLIIYFVIAILYYFINMCFWVDNKTKV